MLSLRGGDIEGYTGLAEKQSAGLITQSLLLTWPWIKEERNRHLSNLRLIYYIE